MPIRKDIMGITGKVSANPKIKADFFYSGEMYVPGEEKKKENETISVEDWRTVVNRAFMKGLTGDEIHQIFRNKEKELTDEMNAYMNKYEGLIGTVFVDSHVIEQGFPMTDIPKKFAPYHRFAINCDDVVMKSTRYVEGGFSGELQSFLDKAANIVTKVVETCRVTGLPVLRKGMFNDQVIDGLLKVLGGEGHGQKALQDALKEKVLGIKKTEEPQAVESDNEAKSVLKYRLKEASFKVPVQIFEEKRYDVDMPLADMPNVDIQAPAEELNINIEDFQRMGKLILADEQLYKDFRSDMVPFLRNGAAHLGYLLGEQKHKETIIKVYDKIVRGLTVRGIVDRLSVSQHTIQQCRMIAVNELACLYELSHRNMR